MADMGGGEAGHMGARDVNGQTNGYANGEGGPTTNGDMGTPKHIVSDDMLYKLSKKIAQLTKVIYSLNTKNDDLELDLEVLRSGYEEKLNKAHTDYNQMREMVHHYQTKLAQELAANSGEETQDGGAKKSGKNDSAAELELRKELKKAKHQLKQYEAKIRGIEEEHKIQISKLSSKDRSPRPELMAIKNQYEMFQKQIEKERQEVNRRLERLEQENENLKTDKMMLSRDVEEISSDNKSLLLQMSACKAEMTLSSEEVPTSKINEDEEKLKDELLQTIDRLSSENGNLHTELEQLSNGIGQVKMQEAVQRDKQKYLFDEELAKEKCEKAHFEKSLLDTREFFEAEVSKLVEEKKKMKDSSDEIKRHSDAEIRHYQQLAGKREEELGMLKNDVMKIKEDLIAQEPKHKAALDDLADRLRISEDEVRRLESELAVSQLTIATSQRQAQGLQDHLTAEQVAARDKGTAQEKEISSLQAELAKTQREMGQANEKLLSLDDKFKIVEVERDDLRKKVKEADVKIEVMGKKQAEGTTKEQYAKELEAALEEALVEREQILEAAEKEIEHERNIAIELEQKMMEDFEWKLREVEGGYKTKIKTLEESLDGKIRTTTFEITRQKDEELTKMCIDARREMEETLRTERSNLKSTLEAAAKTDKENCLATLTLQKDREIRISQRSAEDTQNKLNAEIVRLNSKLKEEVAAQINKIRIEEDAKVFDLNRKHAKIIEKYSEDYDKLKEELTGEINRMRAEHSEVIEEYDAKLENAESIKSVSMFQMKDEVENEFSERMEELRNIYRTEIDQQQEQYSKDSVNWKQLETCLSNKLKETTQTLADTTTYYTAREAELEAKVDDLLTRLQEQTAQVIKLQTEFDEYDWYDGTDDENEDASEVPKNLEMPMSPNSRKKCRSKSNSKETLLGLGRSSRTRLLNETPVHVLSEDEEVEEEKLNETNVMDIPLPVIEPLPQASAIFEPNLPNVAFSSIPRNSDGAVGSFSTIKRNSESSQAPSKEETPPPPVPLRGAGLSLPEETYKNSYQDSAQSTTPSTLVVPFEKSENIEHSDDSEPIIMELPDIYKKALRLPDLPPSEVEKIKKPEPVKDEVPVRPSKLQQEAAKAKKPENTKSWSSFLSSNFGWGGNPAAKK